MGRKSSRKRAKPIVNPAEQPQKWLNESFLAVVFIAGLGCIAWAMYLTESTLIPIKVTVLGCGSIGLIMTVVLWKTLPRYMNISFLLVQFIFNVVVFGGSMVALLLSVNYYLTPVTTVIASEKIISTGVTKSRGMRPRPFVIIRYHGFEKRLKGEPGTVVNGYRLVSMHISKGFLGYDIIRHWELSNE